MSARDFVPPASSLRATRCGSGTIRRRNHRVGGCESAIDHRGKAASVVHDLDEAEGATDIDHAPERILAIGLPKLDLEARGNDGSSDGWFTIPS
jgi:hypothetical protein